jgi:hypothetical protein
MCPSGQATSQRIDRDGRIRTGDPLLPKQVRYQAAPRPEARPSLQPALARSAHPTLQSRAKQRVVDADR